MKGVFISVPNTGWVRGELASFLIQLATTEERYLLRMEFSRGVPTPNNRNGIIKRFLATDADYLVMIDSDVAPRGNPLDLIEYDKDVIGLAVPMVLAAPALRREMPPIIGQLVSMSFTPLDEDGDGDLRYVDLDEADVLPVSTVGASTLVIARRVLEHPEMRGPFGYINNEDGLRICGEDMQFCQRAKAAGFKLWVSLAIPGSHWKEMDLMAVQRAMEVQVAYNTQQALQERELEHALAS